LKREQIGSFALRIFKYLVTIFSSLFLIAGLINPASAEETAPPVLLASQPGLIVNQPPAEVSLGAKFSLNGSIDPVKNGVTIIRQTKKGEKWTTIGSTKTKADGSWNMSTTAPVKKGKTTYRIVVDKGDKPKSDPFTIVFKKAQVNLAAQSAAVNPANPIGFVGTINPPANKVGLQLQIFDAKKKKWVKKASSKTAADGTFNFTVNASRKTAKYKYRVVTTSGITVATESDEQEVAVVPRIEGLGPNGRILGVDISRYQGNINFAKMYAAGARFVFVKSSDGGPNAHGRAVPYADQWIPEAKAAGLLVGQYHFAQIPNTDDMNAVISAANDQADLMISRWNAHGGYSQGTLPLVLDIEQAGVPRNVSDAEALAFVKTWLEKVANATGKLPIIYSNPTFLKNHLSSDGSLANYPLWAANYFDVSNPGVSPKVGCLNTVWTGDGCNLRWTFWQYSQTGPGGTFGVSSRGIDLNVFAGSAEELLALAGYPAAT
jgi:GH25 family lysozyme M1 (1,4-beta-N-acetylmuramidase)/5-hydroxyisourate hydrolase-like protein (transthyretin family)